MGDIVDTVGGLAGGLFGSGGADAAQKGSAAQQEAIRKAIAEYNAGYSGQQDLWNPLRDFGMGAINGLNALNSGDYSGFNQSPDFLFAQQQGNQALGQQQASRGNLFSGGAGKELAQFNQGLASNQLNSYRNQLFNTLNYGQNATGNLSNALTNKTQGIADAQIGIGNARASGYAGAANSYGNAAGNLMDFVSSMWGGGGGGSNTPQVTSNTGGPGYTGGYGGSMFSDRRLKSKIERIGTHQSGLPWYSFEIFGQPSEGVMADEVQKVRPDLVSKHDSGFLMVNYGGL